MAFGAGTADTTTTIAEALAKLYKKVWLETAKQQLVMDQFCRKEKVPKNAGKTVNWPRYRTQTFVTAALTEGENPTEQNMTAQDVEATLEQWGGVFKPTDFYSDTSRDVGLQEYIEEVAEQQGRTYDMLINVEQATENGYPLLAGNDSSYFTTGTPNGSAATIEAEELFSLLGSADDFNGGRVHITATDGTNFGITQPISNYAVSDPNGTITMAGDTTIGSRTPGNFPANPDTTDDFRVIATKNLSSTDVITSADLKRARRALMWNRAKPWTASGHYVMVVDPDVLYDIQSDTTWLDIQKYRTDRTQIFKGEIGKLWGIKVIEHTQPYRQAVTDYSYSSSGAVHVVPVFGKQSIAMAELTSQTAQLIFKKPGPGDTSNPLNMFNTVGWKFTAAAKALNAQYSVNIFCGATA